VSATLVTDRQFGFAVAKDNVSLQEAINESLNEFRATGVYDEIFGKYFGSGTVEEE
jgi:ABC-type amino acid transport substrate-binding protein